VWHHQLGQWLYKQNIVPHLLNKRPPPKKGHTDRPPPDKGHTDRPPPDKDHLPTKATLIDHLPTKATLIDHLPTKATLTDHLPTKATLIDHLSIKALSLKATAHCLKRPLPTKRLPLSKLSLRVLPTPKGLKNYHPLP
jgi:hypothetical protein